MGASKKLKMVMLDKDIKQNEFAKRMGYESTNSVYNMLNRDNMTYATVERWVEALDCEIVFRDKVSGKIYY